MRTDDVALKTPSQHTGGMYKAKAKAATNTTDDLVLSTRHKTSRPCASEDSSVSSPQNNRAVASVPREFASMCMDLLLLDDHLTTKAEFGKFCRDAYAVRVHAMDLSFFAASFWHADMEHSKTRHAAFCCLYFSKCLEDALAILGDKGQAALSRKVHGKHNEVPYCVQMAMVYMDWKAVHGLGANTRRSKTKSVWDDVFTMERVCADSALRCAVRIGMECLKIDAAAFGVEWNPFAADVVHKIYMQA